MNIEFDSPKLLYLFIIIPILILLKFRKKRETRTIKIPNLSAFESNHNWLGKLHPILFILRLLCISLLIIAIARPQKISISENIKKEKGIDILLTVDVSLSMLAKDLQPDRLGALKKVASKFVRERKIDRIGLVAYSGKALTLVPLTSDKTILLKQINTLSTNILEGGTAIGIGLATAINHLKNSQTKSKIIILMSDGVNNEGYIEPEIAADIAKEHGIKVYTIGIGTNGKVLFPTAIDQFNNIIFSEKEGEIDEILLQEIAQKTNGQYFRATNNEALQDIYNVIDKLEKSEINEVKYYNHKDIYRNFLIPSLFLLLLEFILRTFVFRTIN